MFKRDVLSLSEVIWLHLRQNGLETPLLQNRVIDLWEEVAGRIVARYTTEKFIRNQILYVKIQNPALRADLSMMRTQLVSQLNQKVGSRVIIDLKLY